MGLGNGTVLPAWVGDVMGRIWFSKMDPWTSLSKSSEVREGVLLWWPPRRAAGHRSRQRVGPATPFARHNTMAGRLQQWPKEKEEEDFDVVRSTGGAVAVFRCRHRGEVEEEGEEEDEEDEGDGRLNE